MLKENNYTVQSGVELMMTVFPEQEFMNLILKR